MTETKREQVERVLTENGVGEPGLSLHSWRCEWPDRYGPCDCVKGLVDDLMKVIEGQ